MGYVGSTLEVPAGERGLETDANATDLDPRALIVAEGIDQSDDSNRLEGGALLFDDAGLGGTAAATASLGGARAWSAGGLVLEGGVSVAHVQTAGEATDAGYEPEVRGTIDYSLARVPSWVAGMAVYPATPGMTPALVGLLAPSVPTADTVPFSVTLTAPASVGDLVVVYLPHTQRPTTRTAPRNVSVSDSQGNVYTDDVPLKASPQTSSHNPRQAAIFSSVLTTALSIGDTISVSIAGASATIGLTVARYTGATNVGRTGYTAVANGFDSSLNAPFALVGDELVTAPVLRAVLLLESSIAFVTVDSVTLTSPDYTVVDTIAAGGGYTFAPLSRVETVQRRQTAIELLGVSAGNTIVVGFHLYDPFKFASIYHAEPVDSAGNAYVRRVVSFAPDGTTTLLYTADVVVGGNLTITCGTFSVAPIIGARVITASEFTDVNAVDLAAGAAASTPSPSASVPVASQTDDSIVVMVGAFRSSTTVAPSGSATIPVGGEQADTNSDMKGWIQYALVTAAARLVGVYDWHPDSTTQRLISVGDNGATFRSDDPLTDVDATVMTPLVPAPTVTFVAGGKEALGNDRKLFIFNGEDIPAVLSGDAIDTTPLASPPLDWGAPNTDNRPIAGAINANRLWAWGGKKAPHQIYVSALDDHEDFLTEPISYTVYSNIGDRLIAAASFVQRVFFFKWPRGIFVFDTSDPDFRLWSPLVLSQALGCAESPYSVVATDSDVIFLSASGSFHKLSSVDSPDGVEASDITSALKIRRGLRSLMNLGRLSQVRSAWYPLRKWALFAVPSAGSTVNDLLIKFDLSREDIRVTVSRRDIIDALTMRRDVEGIERPVIAEGDLVYELDRDERTKAGLSYGMTYQTPHLDFGSNPSQEVAPAALRAKRKTFDFLELIQRPTGADGTIIVETFIDESDLPRQRLEFNTTVARQRKRLTGNGRTMSLRVTTTADADIASHLVSARVSNEAARRY